MKDLGLQINSVKMNIALTDDKKKKIKSLIILLLII